MGAELAVEDEAAVRDAIAALEVAEGVVPAAAFPALQDPALRSAVTQRLGACGRVLISAGPGWVSGYDDEVADTLADLDVGVLSPNDRAVLALVLLRTVRADGIGRWWRAGWVPGAMGGMLLRVISGGRRDMISACSASTRQQKARPAT